MGPVGGLGLLLRLGTITPDAVGFSDALSTTGEGEDVFESRGRDEGPAPGDDKPSSSACRRILLGRTIRFLIDSSLVLASAPGLSAEETVAVLLSIGWRFAMASLPSSIVNE